MSGEKKEEKKIPRRTFISGVAGAAVVAGVGGFVGGMFSAPAGAERVIEKTVEVPVEVPAAPGVPAAPLYEPSAETRAINAVRKYLADNNLDPKDVALTIMTPAGATSNWDWSWPIWEQLTGIPISNFEVPYGESVPKILPEAAAQTGRWDITCAPPGEPIGDFAEAGLTVPLDDFMQKYDPQYTTIGFGPEAPWPAGPGFEHVTSSSLDNCPVHIVDFATGVYRGRMHSWVTDGDVWNLYLRQDILNDPAVQNRFREENGRLWDDPDAWTWEEYNKVVAFIDRQDISTDGRRTRGAWNYRQRKYSWMDWGLHFYSRGGSMFKTQGLNDTTLIPNFNTPEGLSSLNEQQEITPYMNDIVFSGDFTEQYTDFPRGEAFSAFAWPSLGKYSKDPATAVVGGNVSYRRIPQSVLPDGTRLALSGYYGGVITFINGFSRSLHVKNVAYFYLQWITGPTNSTNVVSKGGFFDMYRVCHFYHPEVIRVYSEPLKTARWNYDHALPPFSVLGAFEFFDKLNVNFNTHYIGGQSAEDALAKAEEEWKAILDRFKADGKESAQLEQWNLQKKYYPAEYRAMMGW